MRHHENKTSGEYSSTLRMNANDNIWANKMVHTRIIEESMNLVTVCCNWPPTPLLLGNAGDDDLGMAEKKVAVGERL